MATIQLSAMQRHGEGGPETPGEMGAFVQQKPWPGGGTCPWLHMSFGRDDVEVWPADAYRVRELGMKLLAIADELDAARPNGLKA